MRREAPFVLYQIARFGILTIAQVRELCAGRCKRTAVYECLKSLAKAEYIERLAPAHFPNGIYRITSLGFDEAMGRSNEYAQKVRGASIPHTVRVTDTLLELSRYEYVSGFATEFEVPADELFDFSRKKIPDAIIQITRGDRKFELAVEVECQQKTWIRSEEFLSKYREVFEHRALCSGVIILCDLNQSYERYQKILSEGDKAFSKRFLLLQGPELPVLSSALYGVRTIRGNTANKARTSSVEGIQYLPVKSINDLETTGSLPPNNEGLVTKSESKEHLQIKN